MHELSIMQALFEQLQGIARTYGARRVLKFRIEVGPLSNVVPELLREAFQAFRAAEPLLEKAEMDLITVPLLLRCQECGHETEPEGFRMICGHCGSREVEVVQGEELLLRDVELEIPEEAFHEQNS